ncbi:MAG: flagellar hook-length control protein FliK [Treponemataceae bacterium]|nr:flagellar hook-length control protein FliK [Treponemataceae bacterium]
MEAMNVRLDQMESLKAASNLALGAKANYVKNDSFAAVLEKAMSPQKSFEPQKPAEAPKAQTVAQKSNDEPKSQQVNDKAGEKPVEKTGQNAEKAETAKAEEKAAEDNSTEIAKAEESVEEKPDAKVASADNAEKLAAEETVELVAENEKSEIAAKNDVQPKVKNEKTEKQENLLENLFAVNQDEESDKIENVAELAENDKKQVKKAGKNSENAELFAVADNSKNAEQSVKAAENNQEIEVAALHANSGKKDAPLIQVVDERSAVEVENKDSGNFVSSVAYDGNGNAEMTLNLAGQNGEMVAGAGFEAKAGETSKSTFASMLSTEIKNNAGDFVKNGLITLRDGNKGSINLILHPEELGNVKIRLELSDKILTGKIIVSSEEAYGAFKNNIETLRQAFIDSGFENAGLELAFASSENGDEAAGQEKQKQNPKAYVYSDALPLAAGAEDFDGSYFELSSVNLMV